MATLSGYLAIRKSTYDAQSSVRKDAILSQGFTDDSGNGVEWLATNADVMTSPFGGGIPYYIRYDTRWSEDQLASQGALFNNIGSITGTLVGRYVNASSADRYRQMFAYILGCLDTLGVITLPENVPDGGTGNRGEEIIAGQGNANPGGIMFLTSLDGWT